MSSSPLAALARAVAAGRSRTLAALDEARARGEEAVELALLVGPPEADPESIVSFYAQQMERKGHLVVHLGGRRGDPLEGSLREQIATTLERLTNQRARVPSEGSVDDPSEDTALEEERRMREQRFGQTLALGAELCELRAPLLVIHDLPAVGPDGRALLHRWLACRHARWFGAGHPIRGLVLGAIPVPEHAAEGTERAEHPELERWSGAPGARTIAVGPLSEEELLQALHQPALVEHLRAATGGHARNLVRSLAQLPGHDAVAIDPSWRELLEAMAVTGDGWSQAVLAEALDAHDLDRFLRSGLLTIWHEGRTSHAALTALARERVLESTSPDRAAALRRAADLHRKHQPERARLLGLTSAPDPDTILTLARELRASGAQGGALELCVTHAPDAADPAWAEVHDLALELGAVCGDVRSLVPIARATLGADRRPTRSLILASRTLSRGGHLREAYERICEWHERVRGPKERDRLVAERGELALTLGELDATQDLIQAALERSDLAPEVRPGLLNILGKVHLSRGQYDTATERFAETLAEASRLGLPRLELRALNNLAVTEMSLQPQADPGRLMHALGSATNVLPRSWALAEANLAVQAHLAGSYSEALDRYRKAIERFRALSDPNLLVPALTNLSFLLNSLGAFDRARDVIAYSEPLLGGVGPLIRADHLLLRAELLRDSRGEADLEEALRILAPVGGTQLCHAWLIKAKRAMDRGEVSAAAEALARANPQTHWHRTSVALAAARLARATGRAPLRSANRAVELLEDEGHLKTLRAWVLRAEIAMDRGDRERARADVERACRLEADLSEGIPAELRSEWSRRPLRARLRELVRRTGARQKLERGRTPTTRRGIVGRSPEMNRLWEQLEKVADSELAILIRGESGTGKELVARAIHDESSRRSEIFLAVNCGAIAETLLESELFGHERGAFTGAGTRREGLFVAAQGGTLFLDEVGDLAPRAQAALLRVLEEGEVLPVGATRAVPVDVRIIAATHHDLEARIREGSFREDLYYRLRGVELRVPPLRERAADLPELVDAILETIARETGLPAPRIDPSVLPALEAYDWPGNVRQLQSVLREACVFATQDRLRRSDLPRLMVGGIPEVTEPGESTLAERAYGRLRRGEVSLRDLKRELERECIRMALDEADGNITRAAQLVGAKRPRLSQLVRELGLKP